MASTDEYGYNAVNLADALVEPAGATTTFAYDDDDRTLTTYPNEVAQRAASTPPATSPSVPQPHGAVAGAAAGCAAGVGQEGGRAE